MMAVALFWSSAAFVVYVYAGYPAMLALWARVKTWRLSDTTPPSDADASPPVSVVIAARNEARHLPARIRNLLALDYPAGQVQIVVVSDGSSDGTLEVLEPFRGAVEVVATPARGKAAALNAGVERARHDILVFTDARQLFAPDAIGTLVAPFRDPMVGGVTGELVLGCEARGGRRAGAERRGSIALERRAVVRQPDDRRAFERRDHLWSTIAEGVGAYWRYEKSLRRLESAVWSTLGATGAIYALRRPLWRPLPDGAILDDVLAPMRAVLAGRRVVFEERAQAFDRAPSDSSIEGRRKLRTLAGNFQILWHEPRLLVPFVNPVWLQYASHKIARLLVPYALMALMAASIALASTQVIYMAALLAQCAFYLLGGYGAWLELRRARA
jgi:cellulose synthase/poly-beta-1,6-N-acetylglucosamine synthase-like glycosyltransferase